MFSAIALQICASSSSLTGASGHSWMDQAFNIKPSEPTGVCSVGFCLSCRHQAEWRWGSEPWCSPGGWGDLSHPIVHWRDDKGRWLAIKSVVFIVSGKVRMMMSRVSKSMEVQRPPCQPYGYVTAAEHVSDVWVYSAFILAWFKQVLEVIAFQIFVIPDVSWSTPPSPFPPLVQK